MGTGSERLDAEDFVRETAVQHQMVWDPSGSSWRHFGVASQPSSIVVGPDGKVLAVFKGSLNLNGVLELLGR